jgi:hypothetical protein
MYVLQGDAELFLSKIFEGICAFDAKDEFDVVFGQLFNHCNQWLRLWIT